MHAVGALGRADHLEDCETDQDHLRCREDGRHRWSRPDVHRTPNVSTPLHPSDRTVEVRPRGHTSVGGPERMTLTRVTQSTEGSG